MIKLNNDWDALLADEFKKDYYLSLRQFLKHEYSTKIIYPDMYDIFNALKLTAHDNTKIVIVGQDPYINKGEAHGLAFSVNHGIKIPPSLLNIFKELSDDIGMDMPKSGCLTAWAKRGVLLLNSVLTVQAGKSRSHAKKGWELFTDYVLSLLNERKKPLVFMLWGNDAKNKGQIITCKHHLVLTAAHPSPLAGGRFFGCKHFSKANEFLGEDAIDWSL